MLDLRVHCLLFIFLKKGQGLPLVLLELFLSRCLQDSCTGLSVMRSPTLCLCCCAKHPGPKANREERKGLLPTPGHPGDCCLLAHSMWLSLHYQAHLPRTSVAYNGWDHPHQSSNKKKPISPAFPPQALVSG